MIYRTPNRRSGFTLVEIVISSTILLVVVGATMSTFLGITKQYTLLATASDISLDIQSASRRVFEAVQASPSAPTILNASGGAGVTTVIVAGPPTISVTSGVSIRLSPATLHYVMVVGNTVPAGSPLPPAPPLPNTGPDILDAATNTTGYVNTRSTINLHTVSPQATTRRLLIDGAACPSGEISTLDNTVFASNSVGYPSGPGNLFEDGDVVTIPVTAFGGAVQLTVRSHTATSLTFTTSLNPALSNWTLPNGTLIENTAGPRTLLTVMSANSGSFQRGDLVLFPDDRDLTRFTLLARNIDPNPRVEPTNPASATESPFNFNNDPDIRELTVNLQCLPAGNRVAGRATAGIRTKIRVRTPTDQRDL